MRVVMSGGGTAGHVFPALAVAERLREAGHEVRFVGSSAGQEATLVPAAGFAFVPVRVASAQVRISPRAVRAVGMTVRAARGLRPLVRSADVVVGIGGYASAPAILAARRTRTPIVLIEPNAVPGVVNRLAARWARAIATTFEATASRLTTTGIVRRTGNPVRREIVAAASARDEHRDDAVAAFALDGARRTVVVLGGSQGAQQLDRLVAGAIGGLAGRTDLQLLVAAGPGKVAEVAPAAAAADGVLVRVEAFIDRVDLALALADVAVARAGSGTISELAVCGVPSILVPYPFATEQHQLANAREVEAAGGAELRPEDALTPAALAAGIAALVGDDRRLASMRSAMHGWAIADADRRIAGLVEEVAA
jgi:UDP-N-acetylglucosamine--N-acetylmuramyl-(pentapeptide) pyrophosphoryl-undecaprenol N-acetylglucosamine transferase